MTLKKMLRGAAASVAAAAVLAGTAFAEPFRLSVVDASQSSVVLPASASNNESNTAVINPDIFPVMVDNREITLQDGMRAVFVTPDSDFPEDKSDLTSFFDEAAGYGMNAVIINTVSVNKDNYSLDLAEEDIIKTAINNARYAGLSAYVTLDVGSLLNRVISEGGGLKEGFTAAAHKFAMKYICDGIIITNYYTSDTEAMHAEYLRSGSGIGYENWLYETNRYIIRTLSEVIRKTTATTAVGLYIEDMWANSNDNEAGSDTSGDFQALYDGYCDTRSYLEQGYADFILVKAVGSRESTTLNFKNVVSWWNDLAAKCGIKVYVCHLNENIGNVEGWNVDQVLKQLVDLNEIGGFGGSAFNSFAALRENKLDNTTSLIKFFNEQINIGALNEELKMVSPTKFTYTTSDATVKFQGTFDENFDVYFNNKKIELNSAGNFFFEERLKAGKNYFTIEHKGKQMNYVITRDIKVFKSVNNTTDITVEGGTRITLSAVVYSGSRVSASINGDLVHLTEKQSSETLDANGSYSEYIGYYTTPDGIVGKEQKLGQIAYYAVYEEPGLKKDEYAYGKTVTVAAKPKPPKTDLNIEITDQSTAGTGEVVGTMDPVVDEDTKVKYIRVLQDYTEVRDPKTTGIVHSPVFSSLPKGTMDYYKSTVGGYIITTSGKRFDADDVEIFTDTGIGQNPLVVKSVGNTNEKSFIKISLKWKIGFNVTAPVKYHTEYEGEYGVKNFDAQYIYITFDNITSVTKLPDFSSCAMFSEGVWEKVTEDGIPKFRMKLKLRQAGVYSGVAAYYDENDDLMLTFNVPTASLAGKTIVVDPGHGMLSGGSIDPGAVGEVTEQVIALAVAKKLTAKLTEMGATVIRFTTESKYYNTAYRCAIARDDYDPDLFVSLHCNSALSETAHGVEVYYFTPFSQPLAKSINDELSELYDNTIYDDGTKSSRGAKYNDFMVTLDHCFPSVLVEMGFVSNSRECLMMADPDNQDKMAESIANGILDYFMRSNLSN